MRFKPTKMELLHVKRELKLAEKGQDLLKKKQDGLVIEFFRVLRDIRHLRGDLAKKLRKAGKSLSFAAAMHGEASVERIALGFAGDVNIERTHRRFMGVSMVDVSEVEIKGGWRPHLESSPELDFAVMSYRRIFPGIVRLAQRQLVLQDLADELRRTKRRVNALEYIIVPRLQSIRDIITFKLEEADRENFTRLKKIKQHVAKNALEA